MFTRNKYVTRLNNCNKAIEKKIQKDIKQNSSTTCTKVKQKTAPKVKTS